MPKDKKPGLFPEPPPKPPQPGPLIKTPPPDLDVITDKDLERVLLAIALFDPRRLYREDGTPIAINEIDDVTALALAGLDVDERIDWQNGKRVDAGITKKFKLSDRQRAVETLLRMRGKLNDSVKVSYDAEALVARLREGRKRAKK